jgi:hypothetical protein
MIADCEVLEELVEEFEGHYGPKKVPVWICLDRTPAGALRNTFDYLPSTEEDERFRKISGARIQLVITELRPGFAGRIRAKGRVQTKDKS